MIRLLDLENGSADYPDTDGNHGECLKIAESEDTPYVLISAPRWNDANKMIENHYEIFNADTGVIESRLRTNFVTAMSVMEAIVNVYLEYQAAGSAEAMGQIEDDGPPIH